MITLQQTEFNIPHWYTEALAVESEGYPRPQEWNKLLLDRVPGRKLLNLDTINLGFIRPNEPDDRQMAYCQAQLYARYMVKRFGDDALIKMLMAYRRGLTTDRAIRNASTSKRLISRRNTSPISTRSSRRSARGSMRRSRSSFLSSSGSSRRSPTMPT